MLKNEWFIYFVVHQCVQLIKLKLFVGEIFCWNISFKKFLHFFAALDFIKLRLHVDLSAKKDDVNNFEKFEWEAINQINVEIRFYDTAATDVVSVVVADVVAVVAAAVAVVPLPHSFTAVSAPSVLTAH